MSDRPSKVFYQFKLVLLGDSGVGKSSLLNRYMDEGFFPNQPCTINADFKIKSLTIDEFSSAQITIWDTCGQERYRSMTGRYFKGAHGIILMYDVADKRSFADLDIWLEEIKKNTIKEDLSIILVGNKIDLKNREISSEEATNLARQFDCNFYEVSAYLGTNVVEIFNVIANAIYQHRKKEKHEKRELKIGNAEENGFGETPKNKKLTLNIVNNPDNANVSTKRKGACC